MSDIAERLLTAVPRRPGNARQVACVALGLDHRSFASKQEIVPRSVEGGADL